eukprot:6196590-Pleurochrysis_carterae.AAC.3
MRVQDASSRQRSNSSHGAANKSNATSMHIHEGRSVGCGERQKPARAKDETSGEQLISQAPSILVRRPRRPRPERSEQGRTIRMIRWAFCALCFLPSVATRRSWRADVGKHYLLNVTHALSASVKDRGRSKEPESHNSCAELHAQLLHSSSADKAQTAAFRQLPNTARRPNFALILADDLGFGDLHSFGHPYSYTPCALAGPSNTCCIRFLGLQGL